MKILLVFLSIGLFSAPATSMYKFFKTAKPNISQKNHKPKKYKLRYYCLNSKNIVGEESLEKTRIFEENIFDVSTGNLVNILGENLDIISNDEKLLFGSLGLCLAISMTCKVYQGACESIRIANKNFFLDNSIEIKVKPILRKKY